MVAINQVANWSGRTQQTSMVSSIVYNGILETADISSNINDFFVSITEYFDPLVPVESPTKCHS